MTVQILFSKLESDKKPFTSGGEIKASFTVAHSDKRTTLEQMLTLTSDDKGWSADMQMIGMPKQKTAKEAAHKYADWLERMAHAIKSSPFEEIDLNDLKLYL